MNLLSVFSSLGPCAVAFSGGVDSCVLARAAVEAARENGWNVLALTAESASMPRAEVEEIRQIATEIGIPLRFVATDELTLPEYRSNSCERCFFCKRHILGKLQTVARELGFSVLVEGSNADDLKDFRPGFRAVKELGVKSPLIEANLTKEDVRQAARFWGLSTAEKPSTPCLASRIAYGVEITPERLGKIERAEAFLAKLGVSPLRVRLHEQELARIETTPDWMKTLLERREELTVELKKLGFSWVSLDLNGFQSGSLNPVQAR